MIVGVILQPLLNTDPKSALHTVQLIRNGNMYIRDILHCHQLARQNTLGKEH